MTVFDTKFRALAESMLNQYAKSMQLQLDGNSIDIKGFPVDYDAKKSNSNISDADFELYVSAIGVEKLGTYIEGQNVLVSFENILYEVVNVSPIYSGEQIALYVLTIRR